MPTRSGSSLRRTTASLQRNSGLTIPQRTPSPPLRYGPRLSVAPGASDRRPRKDGRLSRGLLPPATPVDAIRHRPGTDHHLPVRSAVEPRRRRVDPLTRPAMRRMASRRPRTPRGAALRPAAGRRRSYARSRGVSATHDGGRFERKSVAAMNPADAGELARRAREEMRAAVVRLRADLSPAVLDLDHAGQTSPGPRAQRDAGAPRRTG
jgi:hypothetical protein